MITLPKSTRRHEMLRAVADGKVTLNTRRGAWVAPDYTRRMGCYEWAAGDRMTVGLIEALIELRAADLIVTVPVAGQHIWPVSITPPGRTRLSRWTPPVVTS